MKKTEKTPRNKREKEKQTNKKENKRITTKDTPLTAKEQAFINYYIESNNGKQSAIRAGYSEKSAEVLASRLLSKVNVANTIAEIRAKMRKDSIATGEEVMEYFSKVMRGEILDQFDLEPSLAERTRAAQELARRTVDIENRAKGNPDNKIEINLNWNRN